MSLKAHQAMNYEVTGTKKSRKQDLRIISEMSNVAIARYFISRNSRGTWALVAIVSLSLQFHLPHYAVFAYQMFFN